MLWPTQKIAQYVIREHIRQMANNAYTAACGLESICLHVEDVTRQFTRTMPDTSSVTSSETLAENTKACLEA